MHRLEVWFQTGPAHQSPAIHRNTRRVHRYQRRPTYLAFLHPFLRDPIRIRLRAPVQKTRLSSAALSNVGPPTINPAALSSLNSRGRSEMACAVDVHCILINPRITQNTSDKKLKHVLIHTSRTRPQCFRLH
jgi:hypothetical protein